MTAIITDPSQLESQIRKFVKWARKAGQYNLVKCSSGNLSHRFDDQHILVSQSRSWLSELDENEIVIVKLPEGDVVHGSKPTGELPLHIHTMIENPSIDTVLHFQSPAATTLACQNEKIEDYNVIIEIPIYVGKVATLPFIMPGSSELAKAVAVASKSAGIIQLSNHGQIATGKSYKEAFQRAVFFELACSVIINTRGNYSLLNDESIKNLSGYR